MQILEIELIGFKRIRLDGMRRIKLTFNEIIQVVLGTNGCGKSSLLSEANTLPADQKFFDKDGSKYIKIIKGQDVYEARSWFYPTPRHSFKINGEEQNGTDGGTAAEQKKLTYDHFKITPEIRDLQIGIERFTTMSTTDRRKWLLLLSQINYDYALKKFNEFKTRARDIEGALKHVKKRLVAETEKTISKEQEEKLANEVNQIHRQLSDLFERRAPVQIPSTELKAKNAHLLESMSGLANKLLRMNCLAPFRYDLPNAPIERPRYESLEAIDEVIDILRHKATSKETLLANHHKQYREGSDRLAALRRTGQASMEALQVQLGKLLEDEQECLSKKRLKLEGVKAKEGQAAIDYLFEPLTELLSSIPANPDGQYSSAKMAALEIEINEVTDKISKLDHTLKRLNATEEHMRQHKDNRETECPNCNHRWNIGYDARRHDKLLTEIGEVDKEVGALRLALGQKQALYEANRSYGDQFRAYHRLTRSWPALNPFWDYVQENKYLTESPLRILADLGVFKDDLLFELRAEQIAQERNELDRILRSGDEISILSAESLEEDVKHSAAMIEELTIELRSLQVSISEHQAYRRQVMEMMATKEKLEQMKAEATKRLDDIIDTMYLETVNQCIRQLQTSLSRKQEALDFITNQKGLVEDLTNQVRELEVKEEAAKLLVKALSPTEGLIAEGLLGFINSFLRQINSVIKRVWVYPMEVKSCAASDTPNAELDYKFPLMVEQEDNIVSDIKLASTGQGEIIDLAFLIAALKCLGLLHGPLFLDEFGSSMDPGHKVETANFISNLIKTTPFTQIFLISHDYSQYIALPSVEYAAISEKNIVLPEVYNKHVEIE